MYVVLSRVIVVSDFIYTVSIQFGACMRQVTGKDLDGMDLEELEEICCACNSKKMGLQYEHCFFKNYFNL